MKLKSVFKAICLVLLIPVIQACGSSGGGSTDTTLDVTVTLPTSITAATLPAGTLRVYVNKQGQAPVEMVVSGNSATHTYTGLASGISSTPATYEVTIELDSGLFASAITLGLANNDVTISSGSNSIAFADSLFNLSVDTDSDSTDNLSELIAGSNPLIPTCILGTSQLGNCELGS